MRKTVLLAALVLLAGLAGAQTMIPLPAFSNTYSATMTRGFYCQAPLDFTVVGLRVPDESKHGKQNVCLYKNASAPPAYSGTVPLTPVFKKFGEPSANIIPCAVNYKKGEWLIVIGACGDASRLHNSYAPNGCFQSNVLGKATTLCRCGIQANLITAATPHAVWSENAFNVSRVEVYVASAILAGSGSGSPGTPLDFTLKSAADGGLPYQMGSSFGNGPIPIDTRKLELSPDNLMVLSTSGAVPMIFQGYAGLLDAQGSAKARLDIPNVPALKGVRIYTAFVTLKATAPSGVSSISNSFMFTIM